MALKYIWQQMAPGQHWIDHITFNAEELVEPVGACRFLQGKLSTYMEDLRYEDRLKTFAGILTEEVLATSELAGEPLTPQVANFSVVIRLGIAGPDLPATQSRYADGLVRVLMDAISNSQEPLTAQRLKSWQTALFPGGTSALNNAAVGQWRTAPPQETRGGGAFQTPLPAPSPDRLEGEMTNFLRWFESSKGQGDGILRAALAYFWFMTISPFADGNGRIARVLSDMVLTQDDGRDLRFFSLSPQMMVNREDYLDLWTKIQTGDGDITAWLRWFCDVVQRSLKASEKILESTLQKSRFWARSRALDLTERQKKIVKELFRVGPGGIAGGLTNKKYASMAGVSRQTAQRELADLVKKGVLYTSGAGRAVKYGIAIWQERETERVL